MNIRDITVRFTETAEEEMALLVQEAGIIPLIDHLMKHDAQVPDDLKPLLVRLVGMLTDMFSIELPTVGSTPEETLRSVSRDINLSRVLRERGMFRMFQLLRQRTPDGVAVYMMFNNPDTGQPFRRQEDFIGWFCSNAAVSRSLMFQRLSTIERMEALGFTMDEIFRNILAKPYAMRETLNILATWNGDKIEHINPEVALQVAQRVAPETVPQLEELVAKAGNSQQDEENFHQAMLPLMASLVEEVAHHDRANDALKFIKYDVLMKPEVSYKWENDILYTELTTQAVDQDTGATHMEVVTIPFIPDTTDLPAAIRADLIRRLPIRNKLPVDTYQL